MSRESMVKEYVFIHLFYGKVSNLFILLSISGDNVSPKNIIKEI